MTAEFSDERLSAYLDGELPPAERAEIEALLAASAEHRQLVDELRALRSTLQDLPRCRLAEDFAERVMQRALRAAQAGDPDSPDGTTAVEDGTSIAAATEATGGTSVSELAIRQSLALRRWRRAFWTASTVAATLLVALVGVVAPRSIDRSSMLAFGTSAAPGNAPAAPAAVAPDHDYALPMATEPLAAKLSDSTVEEGLESAPAPAKPQFDGALGGGKPLELTAGASAPGSAGFGGAPSRSKAEEKSAALVAAEDRKRAPGTPGGFGAAQERGSDPANYRKAGTEGAPSPKSAAGMVGGLPGGMGGAGGGPGILGRGAASPRGAAGMLAPAAGVNRATRGAPAPPASDAPAASDTDGTPVAADKRKLDQVLVAPPTPPTLFVRVALPAAKYNEALIDKAFQRSGLKMSAGGAAAAGDKDADEANGAVELKTGQPDAKALAAAALESDLYEVQAPWKEVQGVLDELSKDDQVAITWFVPPLAAVEQNQRRNHEQLRSLSANVENRGDKPQAAADDHVDRLNSRLAEEQHRVLGNSVQRYVSLGKERAKQMQAGGLGDAARGFGQENRAEPGLADSTRFGLGSQAAGRPGGEAGRRTTDRPNQDSDVVRLLLLFEALPAKPAATASPAPAGEKK